jgi:hypothetical protein
MSERPRSDRPRRLADWLNPTGERKVHSLVDKVYKRKNLVLAWEKVKRNQGAGGIDGESLAAFEEKLEERLDRLHEELESDTYRPELVRRHGIPKAGQPGKWRKLGIPTIYDRVCQEALLNRLEPIFDPVFDDASFGYRRGRSPKDALRKEEINPIIRGWGNYYCRAHVRRPFHQLDGWIERRIWSHRFKRWRCRGWKMLPTSKLRGELSLVGLVGLIPSIELRH